MIRINYEKKLTSFFKFCIIFFFIYDVQFIGIPSYLSSRKIVFITILIVYLVKKNFSFKINTSSIEHSTIKNIFFLSIVMVLYTLIITIISALTNSVEGELIFPRICYFVIFGSLTWFFMMDIFKSIDDFSGTVLNVSLVQAIVVILEFFVKPFAVLLSNTFVLDAHTEYLSTIRAVGIGAGDSLLSIDLFFGIVVCSYFILKRKKIFKYVVLSVVIMYAIFISGSIGFLLAATLMFFLLIYIGLYKNDSKLISLVCIVTFGIAALYLLFPEFFKNLEDFQLSIKIQSFFNDGILENKTMMDLRTQAVAPLSLNTLIGTGIYRGTLGNIISFSDTGYLQSYYGFGIFFTVVFYYVLFRNMIKNLLLIVDKDIKFLLCYLFFAIVLMEAKEPYIFHYGGLLLFFMMILLNNRELEKSNLISTKC